MKSLKLTVEEDYFFLLEIGFVFDKIEEDPKQFACVSLYHSASGLFIHFAREYETLSVLLQSEFAKGKHASFDLFYVIKYLNPEIPYGEIRHIKKEEFIRQNLHQIIELFSQEKINETVKALGTEEKKYDKVRWK